MKGTSQQWTTTFIAAAFCLLYSCLSLPSYEANILTKATAAKDDQTTEVLKELQNGLKATSLTAPSVALRSAIALRRAVAPSDWKDLTEQTNNDVAKTALSAASAEAMELCHCGFAGIARRQLRRRIGSGSLSATPWEGFLLQRCLPSAVTDGTKEVTTKSVGVQSVVFDSVSSALRDSSVRVNVVEGGKMVEGYVTKRNAPGVYLQELLALLSLENAGFHNAPKARRFAVRRLLPSGQEERRVFLWESSSVGDRFGSRSRSDLPEAVRSLNRSLDRLFDEFHPLQRKETINRKSDENTIHSRLRKFSSLCDEGYAMTELMMTFESFVSLEDLLELLSKLSKGATRLILLQDAATVESTLSFVRKVIDRVHVAISSIARELFRAVNTSLSLCVLHRDVIPRNIGIRDVIEREGEQGHGRGRRWLEQCIVHANCFSSADFLEALVLDWDSSCFLDHPCSTTESTTGQDYACSAARKEGEDAGSSLNDIDCVVKQLSNRSMLLRSCDWEETMTMGNEDNEDGNLGEVFRPTDGFDDRISLARSLVFSLTPDTFAPRRQSPQYSEMALKASSSPAHSPPLRLLLPQDVVFAQLEAPIVQIERGKIKGEKNRMTEEHNDERPLWEELLLEWVRQQRGNKPAVTSPSDKQSHRASNCAFKDTAEECLHFFGVGDTSRASACQQGLTAREKRRFKLLTTRSTESFSSPLDPTALDAFVSLLPEVKGTVLYLTNHPDSSKHYSLSFDVFSLFLCSITILPAVLSSYFICYVVFSLQALERSSSNVNRVLFISSDPFVSTLILSAVRRLSKSFARKVIVLDLCHLIAVDEEKVDDSLFPTDCWDKLRQFVERDGDRVAVLVHMSAELAESDDAAADDTFSPLFSQLIGMEKGIDRALKRKEKSSSASSATDLLLFFYSWKWNNEEGKGGETNEKDGRPKTPFTEKERERQKAVPFSVVRRWRDRWHAVCPAREGRSTRQLADPAKGFVGGRCLA